MPVHFSVAICLLLASMTMAAAQNDESTRVEIVAPDTVAPFPGQDRRQRLGYGRLTTNDLIGDGKDRWRTGSVTSSRVWGYGWDGAAPQSFGDLLELRLQGQIIQPDSLRQAVPGDRPWAGALSFGLHTHWTQGQTEFALGGDLVVIGPQTQLDHLQTNLHNLLGISQPSSAVLTQQIGDKVRPTLVAEVGQIYSFGTTTRVRPFAEARAGDETLVRIGADITFGSFGDGELMVRESVTGQRYRTVRDPSSGFSFLVGADSAYVASSVYLPEDRGYDLTDRRDRVRAGVHWQGEGRSIFYGATWLGREFEGQPEGQVVGSVRLQFQF